MKKNKPEISEKILSDLDCYIRQHYIPKNTILNQHLCEINFFKVQNLEFLNEVADYQETDESDFQQPVFDNVKLGAGLLNIKALDEPFMTTLFRLIDSKGLKDADVYKKANIDRRHFSKMRINPTYTPSKRTALALAIALELELEQTKDLLSKAGYTLSHSIKFDVIIEYFIVNKEFDINKINDVLLYYDQVLLGV